MSVCPVHMLHYRSGPLLHSPLFLLKVAPPHPRSPPKGLPLVHSLEVLSRQFLSFGAEGIGGRVYSLVCAVLSGS